MATAALKAQGMSPVSHPPGVTGATVQLQHPQPIQAQLPTQNTRPERRDRYKNILFGLGITEVILGCICVLFGLAAIIVAANSPPVYRYDSPYGYSYNRYRYHGFTHVSQGIWCGLFLVATGTLGIKAKRSPSVCMYNANMALSIISACLMVPLIVLSAIAAAIEAGEPSYKHRLHSLIALHILIAVIGFIAAILCIVHSAYCCAGVCNCQHGYPIVFTAQPYAHQQMVMLPNGQFVPLQMQPYPIHGQVLAQLPEGQAAIPRVVMQPLGYNEQPTHQQTTRASSVAPLATGYSPQLEQL